MTELRQPDLVDMVRELVDQHSHAEHYQVQRGQTWYGQNHVTHVPALIEQLWDAPEPSATVEEGPRPGFGSKPAARLEAYDVAIMIDLEAARWVRELGHDDPGDKIDKRTGRVIHGSGTAACIRLLGSLAPSETPATRRKIEHDVRRWWTQARIVTGWDSPPWKPDNTCPVCAVRGELKVNFALQAGFCQSCRATWDAMTIGLLADHIRAESEEHRSPQEGPPTCAQVPRPEGLPWGICPACASSSCRRAVDLATDQELKRLSIAEARRERRSREEQLLEAKRLAEEYRADRSWSA